MQKNKHRLVNSQKKYMLENKKTIAESDVIGRLNKKADFKSVEQKCIKSMMCL